MTSLPSNAQHDALSDCTIDDLAEAAKPSGLRDRNEAELCSAAQSGDCAAFAELYARYQPRLVKFLDKRLRYTNQEAEDIAQIAFTKAWQAMASYDSTRRFSTWLYTIAVRAATDSLRRSKLPVDRSLPVECLAAQSQSARDSIELDENRENLWATAHATLPTAQYDVLWLRYSEDLAVAEIAKILGRTTVGVRVLLHRARGRLQNSMVGDTDKKPHATKERTSEVTPSQLEGSQL